MHGKSSLTLDRTTGGAKGTTTTVTTLDQLTKAAIAEGPAIILVQGAISGAAKVQVGSDKTIIGKTGSCKFGYLFILTSILIRQP